VPRVLEDAWSPAIVHARQRERRRRCRRGPTRATNRRAPDRDRGRRIRAPRLSRADTIPRGSARSAARPHLSWGRRRVPTSLVPRRKLDAVARVSLRTRVRTTIATLARGERVGPDRRRCRQTARAAAVRQLARYRPLVGLASRPVAACSWLRAHRDTSSSADHVRRLTHSSGGRCSSGSHFSIICFDLEVSAHRRRNEAGGARRAV